MPPPSSSFPLPGASGSPHSGVIEGDYLRDLLAQPEALRATARRFAAEVLPALKAVAAAYQTGCYRRVVLTGMGSSLHALYPLHLQLSQRGIASCWVETAELLAGFDGLYRHDTLLVAASQSGESAEIVALLQRSEAFGHIIGITNHRPSTLGRSAGTVADLGVGPEATVSCKTYLATLAMAQGMGRVLRGEDATRLPAELDSVSDAIGEYLGQWRAHVAALLPLVAGVQSVFVTGRGSSLATAGTGGLILKESTRQPAEGMSCPAFRHGPFEMADQRALVLVLAGDEQTAGLNRRLYDDIVNGGGRAAWIAEHDASTEVFRLPSVGSDLRPIVEMLPVQMLSLALAAREGREAGRFTRANKITTIA